MFSSLVKRVYSSPCLRTQLSCCTSLHSSSILHDKEPSECLQVKGSSVNKENSPESPPSHELLGIQDKALGSTEVQNLLNNACTGSDASPESPEDVWLRTPYRDEHRRRSQASKALRPKVDPRETSIILFPGQGAQFVGMLSTGIKLPAVKKLFKQANEILGYDLLDMCLNGPKSKLDMTVHCQPAVFVSSLAAMEVMMETRRTAVESCFATAGFSVGEFAALVFAGSLSFEAALRLIKIRSEAMQTLSEEIPSGMTTCFLKPDAKIGDILNKAVEWCRDNGVEQPVCSVANHLWPHCKVIAGHIQALEYIENNTGALKIRRTKRLPVSGAFHTALMEPAVDVLRKAISNVKVNDPQISVHSNIDGLIYFNAASIKKKLPKQISKPVKWEQVIHIMYDREKGTEFPTTFECGPGNSLNLMLKYQNRIAAEKCLNVYA